jgi:hypothetical protein
VSVWRNFDASSIPEVPASAGAYRLYRNARVIYVGMAGGGATLRSELRRHLRGDFGLPTQAATELEYREAPDALSAYQVYLEFHLSSGPAPSLPKVARSRRACGRA